jgi:hypothetical protein
VSEPAASAVKWRTPSPARGWRPRLIWRAAEAEVAAPDGRYYVVRATRLLWPDFTSRRGPGREFVVDGITDGAAGAAGSLSTSRFVWAVRVYRKRPQFRLPSLVYGEELRHRDSCVRRAHEIADGLAAGRSPKSAT